MVPHRTKHEFRGMMGSDENTPFYQKKIHQELHGDITNQLSSQSTIVVQDIYMYMRKRSSQAKR
eukprot:scaffold10389_cov82-Skeletonema_marinoi.AAC.1